MDKVPPSHEPMLSAFIRSHLEEILAEWDQFAKVVLWPRQMDAAGLRDHAGGMMLAIADDLEQEQTPQEQDDKAKGRAPARQSESEAELHGAARFASGLTVAEAIAEFRALRASVLRLWIAARGPIDAPWEAQTIRFNEAVDEALTASLRRFALSKDDITRQFDTLLSASPDLQYVVAPDGTLVYANRALVSLFSKPAEDVIGKNIRELCPDLATELQDQLRAVVATLVPHVGELACNALPRSPVAYRNVLIPVIADGERVESITGMARNISELKASEDQILRNAYYDSLTGLPNRVLFRDRLEQEVKHAGRSGRPLALLYVDLDGFKEVNDRHGHAEGDILLREAARRLAGRVRTSDTVARLGGDEFIILLTEVAKIAHVEVLAQEILHSLAMPFSVRGNEMRISGSIGITLYPQDSSSPDDLVRNADQAMFVAKKAGRNRFSFFTREMRDAAWARLCIIDELRQALVSRQIAVFYQPIIELASGAIVKAEALVRWQHPRDGLILPSAFIGLAEETGLIGAIDAIVLEQVVACAHRWNALLGMPFQISINKSPVEFLDRNQMMPGDPEILRFEAAAARVAIEITEGVMLSDSPAIHDKLMMLKRAGVQFTIDDFGVGYSSMAYLKKFSVDFLKIDQSFVRDLIANYESRVFVETIIIMAHKLGLKVIAEGVETAEQRDWLKAVDCDYAQGFLFSEAVNGESFEALLGNAR